RFRIVNPPSGPYVPQVRAKRPQSPPRPAGFALRRANLAGPAIRPTLHPPWRLDLNALPSLQPKPLPAAALQPAAVQPRRRRSALVPRSPGPSVLRPELARQGGAGGP